MKTNQALSAPVLLVAGLLAVLPRESARGSAFSQPVTFAGQYSNPVQATGSSFGPSVHFSGGFLWWSWNDTLSLQFTPVATVSGSVISITCPGTANLNLGSCSTEDSVTFVPNGSGTASMAAQVQLGLKMALLWNGSGPSGTLKAPNTFSFTGSQSLPCFAFASTTVSDTQTDSLFSENVLGDISAAFGIPIPDWLASIDLNVDATVTLQETVTSLGISTSAGSAVSCEQPIPVTPVNCEVSLSNVTEEWMDYLSVSEGLGASVSVSLLFGLISWSSGEVVSSGPLLSEITVVDVYSPPQGVSFALPSYIVNVVQASGGTISPAAPFIACEGQCATFRATPSNWWETYCCGWFVDGVRQTQGVRGGIFTLSDIQGNHTVTAEFCTIPVVPIGPFNVVAQAMLAGTGTGTGGGWLTGQFNPEGSAGAAWFAYGTTPECKQTTPPVSFDAVTNTLSISNLVANTTPNTAYYYTLVMTNGYGIFSGDLQSITTAGVPPTVGQASVTELSATSITLNGSVNPQGDLTAVWAVLMAGAGGGSNGTGGTQVSRVIPLGNPVTNTLFSLEFTNLQPATLYSYVITASNNFGAISFANEFMQPGQPPVASSAGATNVTATGAQLGGLITPDGLETQYWLNWGTNANYGFSTPPQGAGNSGTNLTVFADLAGLTPDTIYHAQFAASNAAGLALSPDVVFTTADPLPAILFQPAFVPGAGFQFQFAGSPGVVYAVRQTPNLVPPVGWKPLTALTMSSNVVTVVDPGVTTAQKAGFYQAWRPAGGTAP